MSSFRILFTLLAVASTVYLTGCGEHAQSKEKQAKDQVQVTVVPVEVEQVQQGMIADYVYGTATLEAEQEATAVAKVSGQVTQILVEEGDWVEAEQVLAYLDREKLKLELQRSEAKLRQLENEVHRAAKVFDKKLISSEAYEKLRFEWDAQNAAYQLIALDLAHTAIKAPIAGQIAWRHIKIGKMLLINDSAFQIVNPRALKAVLNVPEQDFYRLSVGQQAKVGIDALVGHVFVGDVQRISPTIDPDSGTFRVTIKLKQDQTHLLPGMFGRIRIIANTHPEAMLISKNAVLERDGEQSVFLVSEGIAKRMPVQTGFTDQSLIEITTGLSVNDWVVTTGHIALKDNSQVEVVSTL